MTEGLQKKTIRSRFALALFLYFILLLLLILVYLLIHGSFSTQFTKKICRAGFRCDAINNAFFLYLCVCENANFPFCWPNGVHETHFLLLLSPSFPMKISFFFLQTLDILLTSVPNWKEMNRRRKTYRKKTKRVYNQKLSSL